MNSSKNLWDVVVIGAGPAGALAATLLARQRLRVALVERCRLPRFKVCGGCLNARGISVLSQLKLAHVVDEADGESLQGIRFVRTGRHLALNGRFGAVVDRGKFDAALTREARDSGAEVYDGAIATVLPAHPIDHRIVAISRDGECVDELPTRLVVAADGLGNPSLRKLAGFGTKANCGSRFGIGVVTDTPADSSAYAGGLLFMAVGNDGYAGASRLADGRLCIAAAADPGIMNSGQCLGEWLSLTLATAGLPAICGLNNATIKGTLPLMRTAKCVAGDRIFVVGDAAGYVEPITGEGMGWALAAAARLAPIAADACRHWNGQHASAWRRELRRTVFRRQAVNRLLAAALRRPRWRDGVFRAACAFPTLATSIAQHLNRPASIAGTAA